MKPKKQSARPLEPTAEPVNPEAPRPKRERDPLSAAAADLRDSTRQIVQTEARIERLSTALAGAQAELRAAVQAQKKAQTTLNSFTTPLNLQPTSTHDPNPETEQEEL